MLYGIYFIKYYYFIINENNFSLMSQLRQAPTTERIKDECIKVELIKDEGIKSEHIKI